MTQTTTTQATVAPAVMALRAAGWTEAKINKYEGWCACGCNHFIGAGEGRVVRRPGSGYGWALLRRRMDCTVALLRAMGAPQGEALTQDELDHTDW